MKKEMYNPQKEDLYEIKEDIMGPGARPGELVSGMTSTMNMTRTAIGHPKIRWYDKSRMETFIIEGDMYLIDGELSLQIYCPRCRNNLKISSNRKQMDYNVNTEELSIEPFECTWEIQEEIRDNPNKGNHNIIMNNSLCRWKVGIDKNIAKDAK